MSLASAQVVNIALLDEVDVVFVEVATLQLFLHLLFFTDVVDGVFIVA